MTRRAFAGAIIAARLASGADGWEDLFDGRSLEGWSAGDNKDSWKVADRQISADGPTSHLFYTGPVRGAMFRNFELDVEALALPAANSGVYFHTAFQEKGFPRKGFEIQINNTAAGAGGYRERKKTGSLYAIRNVYKQLAADDEWFRIQAAVRGKNVQVRLNGILVVDYTEPATPVIPESNERERYLDRGTFALQCHDPGSKVRFRRIRVRPLPDNLPAGAGPLPDADDTFRRIIQLGAKNVPLVDYHVHLKNGLTLERALEKSRRDGIQYGISVNCGKGVPVQDDASARRFVESLEGQPVFVGMQAEGREWTQMFSRSAAALFDYVLTDALSSTGAGAIADAQEFMNTLVERIVGILEREPVDIYANPTFLPAAIERDYDGLWTEERMKKVIDAAARNGVAIEINNRYRLPRLAFLRMAKEAGCKFAFGSNNGGPDDLGRSEYGLRMVEECKLSWQDFFVPGAWQAKAVERKGGVLLG